MTKPAKYFIVDNADLLKRQEEGIVLEGLDEITETLFDLLNCKTFRGLGT